MLALVAMSSVIPADPPPLNIVISNWPPYKSMELIDGGVATDITKEALNRAGYQVTVVNVPWKRALVGAYNGAYDVVPAIWSSPEREQKLFFSDPILDSRVVVIWLDSFRFNYENMGDLKGKSVGVGRGWSYPLAFENADFFKRLPAVDLEANFRRLFARRVNIIVGEELAARYVLQKKFSDRSGHVRFSSASLQVKPLKVAFSRSLNNYKDITRKFNAAMQSIRDDGTYEMLLRKHNFIEPGEALKQAN